MNLARTQERAGKTALRGGSALLAGALAMALLSPLAATAADDKPTFKTTSIAAGETGYQVAYSEKNDVMWVTGSTHEFKDRPVPVRSTLTKVDPNTMKVLQTIEPPRLQPSSANPHERAEAVYGVAVDDKNDRVWTSVTREDAVVVYDAKTGNRLKRIDGVGHARDIAIDSDGGSAYVSDPNGGAIAKIDLATLEVTETLKGLGGEFSPMSLDLVTQGSDAKLYTVNLNDGAVIEIDLRQKAAKVLGQSGGEGASGIAVDAGRKRVYVASQKSADVRTLDLETGRLLNTANAGAAALNSAVDTEKGFVYTTLFGDNHILVTDATTGDLVDRVEIGLNPNDVTVAKGAAWSIDRQEQARLWKITEGNGGEPTEPTEPGTPAKAEVTIERTAHLGGTIVVKGTGFTHPKGGGSKIAVKFARDQYKKTDGNTIWASIQADRNGNFTKKITLPDGTSEGSLGTIPALPVGATELFFLTGSSKPGDAARSIRVPLTVGPSVSLSSPQLTAGEPFTATFGNLPAGTAWRLASTTTNPPANLGRGTVAEDGTASFEGKLPADYADGRYQWKLTLGGRSDAVTYDIDYFVGAEPEAVETPDIDDEEPGTAAVATKVSASAAKQVYGKAATVRVNVSAAGAKPVGTVRLTAGSKSVSAKVSAGVASVKVPAGWLKPGRRDLAISFTDASGAFAASKSKVRVNVAKAQPKVGVKAAKKSVKRGTKAVFRVSVKAPGVKPGGKVRVKVAGSKAKTVKLNKNGNAKVVVRVGKKTKPGVKKVRVTYGGNELVAKASKASKIRVTG